MAQLRRLRGDGHGCNSETDNGADCGADLRAPTHASGDTRHQVFTVVQEEVVGYRRACQHLDNTLDRPPLIGYTLTERPSRARVVPIESQAVESNSRSRAEVLPHQGAPI